MSYAPYDPKKLSTLGKIIIKAVKLLRLAHVDESDPEQHKVCDARDRLV